MEYFGCFWGGIWPNLLVLEWHYTTHQHYNFPVWNSSVGQTWPRLRLTEACNNLHISPIWFLKWAHLKIGSMTHTDPSCNLHSRQSLFCTVGILGVPQACNPEYSHISGGTWGIYGRDHHWESSPSVDLLRRACTSQLQGVAVSHDLWMIAGDGGGEKTLQDLPLVLSLIALPSAWHIFFRWGNWFGPLCRTLGWLWHIGSLLLILTGLFQCIVQLVSLQSGCNQGISTCSGCSGLGTCSLGRFSANFSSPGVLKG